MMSPMTIGQARFGHGGRRGGRPRGRGAASIVLAVAVVAVTLVLGVAPSGAVPPSLTVTPSSGTGTDQITVALDPSWVTGCDVTYTQPVGIDFQSASTPGTAIVESALLDPAQPSVALSVDTWFSDTAYQAGTYWFVGFCFATGTGAARYTEAIPFQVTAAQIPTAMKIGLDPVTGPAGTDVTVTADPPFPAGAVPCAPGSSAQVVTSTSSYRLDSTAVVNRTPIAPPTATETKTLPLERWLGGSATAPTYWFWLECPYVNDASRTAYSPAAAFAVQAAPTTTTATTAVPARPVSTAVAPAFTG